MSCFCRSSKTISLRIILLDETDFLHEIQVSYATHVDMSDEVISELECHNINDAIRDSILHYHTVDDFMIYEIESSRDSCQTVFLNYRNHLPSFSFDTQSTTSVKKWTVLHSFIRQRDQSSRLTREWELFVAAGLNLKVESWLTYGNRIIISFEFDI